MWRSEAFLRKITNLGKLDEYIAKIFPILRIVLLGSLDTECNEKKVEFNKIVPEHVAAKDQQKVKKIVDEIHTRLNITDTNPLILWSGYEQGMLELAVRYALKIGSCTIEFSKLSNNFVRICGSWDDQVKCISDEIKKQNIKIKLDVDDDVRTYMAILLRKQLWDYISSAWAARNVKTCVAFIPHEPELNKTLFQIEFPLLLPNVEINIVHCRRNSGFDIYRAKTKKELPEILRHVFNSDVVNSQAFKTWAAKLSTSS